MDVVQRQVVLSPLKVKTRARGGLTRLLCGADVARLTHEEERTYSPEVNCAEVAL